MTPKEEKKKTKAAVKNKTPKDKAKAIKKVKPEVKAKAKKASPKKKKKPKKRSTSLADKTAYNQIIGGTKAFYFFDIHTSTHVAKYH